MDYIRKPLAYLRSESAIESIMKLRLLLGHYYRSSYPIYIDYLIRLYVLGYTIIVIMAMVLCVTRDSHFSVFISIVLDFFCNNLISFISGQSYYLKFYAAIRNIDESSGYRGPFISLRSYSFVILVVVVRIIVYYFQSTYMLSVYEPLVRSAMWLCLSISYLPIVIVFDILHLRIKSLRQDLECGIRSEMVPVLNKIDHLKRVIRVYNDLLDKFNENNLTMQISMCVSILLAFPREIILTYVTIERFLRGSYFGVVGPISSIIHNIANVCYPSILAEMTIQEIDRLHKYLSSQLVTCEDNRLRNEINFALEILSLRPFKFTILRAIYVDGNLPKKFISLCVTYVIVMVQMLKFKN